MHRPRCIRPSSRFASTTAITAALSACSVYDDSLLLPAGLDAGAEAEAAIDAAVVDDGDAQRGDAEAGADAGEDGAEDAAADADVDHDAGRCGNGVVEAGEDCEPPGTPACDDQCHARCDVTGPWALELKVPVSWTSSKSGLKAGSGDLLQWLLLDRRMTGMGGVESGNVCKLVLPDFVTSVSGMHQLVLPSPFGFPAPFSTTVAFDGFEPGARYMAQPAVVLVGARFAEPLSDRWPANTTLANNASSATKPYATDDDDDENLGITATWTTGDDYVLPSMFLARADKVYLSLRSVASLSGDVVDCTRMTGSATVQAVDFAFVGCHVSGGKDCTASQRDTLEGLRPTYSVSGGASFEMVKLDAGATCAQAIAALP